MVGIKLGHVTIGLSAPMQEERLFFDGSSSGYLSYIRHEPSHKGMPWVVFLSGFRSDKQGSKAVYGDAWAREKGVGYLRFDYRGHGASSSVFETCCLSDWLEDVLHILDRLVPEPALLVGSSMGGWLMLLAALQRPEKIRALLGIASAPDFTEDLIMTALSPIEKQELATNGVVYLPDCYGDQPYPITSQLIEDGKRHLMLRQPTIPIHCPVSLMHGMKDEDVPWQTSVSLAEKLESEDVTITLHKQGDHRMSDAESLKQMVSAIERLIQKTTL